MIFFYQQKNNICNHKNIADIIRYRHIKIKKRQQTKTKTKRNRKQTNNPYDSSGGGGCIGI